jgi:putative ABC transport system ATP-binding protein
MLATQNLQFAYAQGAAMAFPDVDLPQGRVLLLQGASGSGKSTLLALACALLAPSKGRITVAGQDLALLQGSQRDAWRGRHVGFLPQRLHLSESLTVHGNLGLAFFAAGLAEDSTKIEAALQALGVADLAQRLPSQLSGGQAQRVALARAVLLSPKIILADEPTASLDDEAASLSCELLVQAAQRCGATLVIATHDARVGQALAGLGQGVQALKLEKSSQIGISTA